MSPKSSAKHKPTTRTRTRSQTRTQTPSIGASDNAGAVAVSCATAPLPAPALVPALVPTPPVSLPDRTNAGQRSLKVSVIRARAELLKSLAATEGKRSLLTFVEIRDKRVCDDCGHRFFFQTGSPARMFCPACLGENVHDGAKDSDRMFAANSILDRAFGKPAQEVQHTGQDGEALFTIVELPSNGRETVALLTSSMVPPDEQGSAEEGELLDVE